MNWIEITTRIGCKNMCSYCPQSKFISNYKHPKKIMTIDDFDLFLNNIDKNKTQIHFSGFSESFLNDDSHIMMSHAYNLGYQVVLYTTMEGLNQDKIEYLKNNIVFHDVNFHKYDGIGYNEEKYLKTKNKFIENIRSVGGYHEATITTPSSRGGNNWEIPRKSGRLSCYRFYNNVLLPNGDIFLCCSDWSLNHKIGNLYENHYSSEELNKVRESLIELASIPNSEILCRTCEESREY